MSTFFHIGYPKAASTTLQLRLFTQHDQINYLGLTGTYNTGRATAKNREQQFSAYAVDPSLRAFYKCLFMGDVTGTEQHVNYVRERYLSPRSVNVLSHELMTSPLFFNSDLRAKAVSLQQVLPTCKIIIVIREQRSMLVSQYRDHPFDPSAILEGRPMKFEDWVRAQLSVQDSFMASLNYCDVVTTYVELFGMENVLVVPFELLVLDPESVCKDMLEFMGLDGLPKHFAFTSNNSGLSSANIKFRQIKRNIKSRFNAGKFLAAPLKKWINNLAYIGLSIIDSKPAAIDFAGFDDIILNYYGATNAELDSRYGLNLQKLGYVQE